MSSMQLGDSMHIADTQSRMSSMKQEEKIGRE